VVVVISPGLPPHNQHGPPAQLLRHEEAVVFLKGTHLIADSGVSLKFKWTRLFSWFVTLSLISMAQQLGRLEWWPVRH